MPPQALLRALLDGTLGTSRQVHTYNPAHPQDSLAWVTPATLCSVQAQVLKPKINPSLCRVTWPGLTPGGQVLPRSGPRPAGSAHMTWVPLSTSATDYSPNGCETQGEASFTAQPFKVQSALPRGSQRQWQTTPGARPGQGCDEAGPGVPQGGALGADGSLSLSTWGRLRRRAVSAWVSGNTCPQAWGFTV